MPTSPEATLVLRPRRSFVLLGIVAIIGLPAFLFKLAYDAAELDPRIPMFTLLAPVFIAMLLRARIVVQGADARRRVWRREMTVGLDRLATVEVRRAKFFRQEGWVRTMLSVTDADGGSFTLKPFLWQRGAADFVRLLRLCAQVQGIAPDDKTREYLARRSERSHLTVPAWTRRERVVTQDAPVALPMATTSNFWTRFNDDGSEKKFQPQRLVLLVGMGAVVLPIMFVSGRVGTDAVRSARCAADRDLWSEAADVPAATVDANALVERIRRQAPVPGVPFVYSLDRHGISSPGNTKAVQRDARRLVQGFTLRWGRGNDTVDVQVEDFGTHPAALAFHRAYAEDHCHSGDDTFWTPGIPGGLGIRCNCDSVVDDRVSFVRGAIRVQVYAWGLRANDGHDKALSVAAKVLKAFDAAE
jgi:hypothetical protein